ncbi:MAG: prephenate dehydrogenase/arogenate dehydrogenase family protein [Proteobacteria bacterium]|nr:prephenate dehydrogenase/arogenate dehydrogenase family protein [Pseudomonadota bacterium]
MKSVTIGIIGGSGGMGRLFEGVFKKSGHHVLIAGRKTVLTYEDLARKSDVVILSAPADASIEICKSVGPLMTEDQLLMDFCSLKEDIVTAMLSYTEKAEVVGTHPMFGPFTESLEGQNIVLCPGRGDKWQAWLKSEFQKLGAEILVMPAITHDKNMAVVQGLTHLLTICTGRTLQKINMTPDDAVLYATPIFRMNIDLIGRLFAQDLELFSMLVGKNRYVPDVIDTFIKAMEEGKRLLVNGCPEEGIRFLEDIKGFLGDFCEEGLKQSNRYLNHVVRKKDNGHPTK